jgi:hypothetical protein
MRLMEEAPEHCILCGASEREPLIRQGSCNVNRCTHCGLGFLDPPPSKEDFGCSRSRPIIRQL